MRYRSSFLIIFVFLISGCASLPLKGEIPSGFSLTRLAAIDENAPFAPSPSGNEIAFGRGGVKVLRVVSKEVQSLNSERPSALAWSPGGKRLAAAFAAESGSALRIYDFDGGVSAETQLDGFVNDIAWSSENDLLALSVTLKVYSFAGDYTVLLWGWNGVGTPSKSVIGNTSLKPQTLKRLGDAVYRTARMDLSPFGDEILYTRLQDPPVFTPYLKNIVRHLETGAETDLFDSPKVVRGAFLPDGETLLLGDGSRGLYRVVPRETVVVEEIPSPGIRLDISPSGRYLLADGRLYDEKENILEFLPGTTGRFSGEGRLFVRTGSSLWLLEGLSKEMTPVLSKEEKKTILKFRNWRSSNLITQEEYRSMMERLMKP